MQGLIGRYCKKRYANQFVDIVFGSYFRGYDSENECLGCVKQDRECCVFLPNRGTGTRGKYSTVDRIKPRCNLLQRGCL